MSGPGDFDFLVGSWNVANRRLAQPLTGSGEWDEFPSASECRSVFGGAANFDEISIPARGFHGLTLRLFDPGSEEWSLHWASSRDGRLQPPVAGCFAGGVGTFYSRETYDGAEITVRFIWSEITADSARRTASTSEATPTPPASTDRTRWKSCTSSCSGRPGDRRPRHSPRNADQKIELPITSREWAECLPQKLHRKEQ